jgi:hypothetical protein
MRARTVILYTGVQSSWPKKLLMRPAAGEQNTVVCSLAQSVFRPQPVQTGVNHHGSGTDFVNRGARIR